MTMSDHAAAALALFKARRQEFPAITTAWTQVGPEDDEIAEEDEAEKEARLVSEARDFLFRLRVQQVLDEQMPWLMPILRAAGAKVVAGPGQCFVVYGEDPTDPDSFVAIPELGAHLVLMPWAEDGQMAN